MATTSSPEPADVVVGFLRALAAPDIEVALLLVTEDLALLGLWAVRGA